MKMLLKMFIKECRLQVKTLLFLLIFMTLTLSSPPVTLESVPAQNMQKPASAIWFSIYMMFVAGLSYYLIHKEIKENTLSFLVTKPITRANIVIVKYFSGIVMIGLVFLLSVIICLVLKNLLLLTGIPREFLPNMPYFPENKILVEAIFTIIALYTTAFFVTVWMGTRIILIAIGFYTVTLFGGFMSSFAPNKFSAYILPSITLEQLINIPIFICMLISSIAIFRKKEIGGV